MLLEHPPVYTKGRRSTSDELPMGEDWYRMQGIDVAKPTAVGVSPPRSRASSSAIRS